MPSNGIKSNGTTFGLRWMCVCHHVNVAVRWIVCGQTAAQSYFVIVYSFQNTKQTPHPHDMRVYSDPGYVYRPQRVVQLTKKSKHRNKWVFIKNRPFDKKPSRVFVLFRTQFYEFSTYCNDFIFMFVYVAWCVAQKAGLSWNCLLKTSKKPSLSGFIGGKMLSTKKNRLL